MTKIRERKRESYNQKGQSWINNDWAARKLQYGMQGFVKKICRTQFLSDSKWEWTPLSCPTPLGIIQYFGSVGVCVFTPSYIVYHRPSNQQGNIRVFYESKLTARNGRSKDCQSITNSVSAVIAVIIVMVGDK